jgi:ATP-dependent DNA helicase RecG
MTESDLLQTDIKFLTGVGPKRAEMLNKELQVFCFRDLIYYFPYKHIDRSRIYKVNELNPELASIQLCGKISNFRTEGHKAKSRLMATFSDETGTLELLWFQGIKWIKQGINEDKQYILFGKPSVFNGRLNLIHPEVDEADQFEQKLTGGLQAVYSIPEKLKKNFISSRTINKLQYNVLQKVYNVIPETLPAYLLNSMKLMPLKTAIREIHFPSGHENLNKAVFRLKFEELFYIQLHILKQKYMKLNKSAGFKFAVVGSYLNDFYKSKIPFELTNAQKRVIREIRADMGSGKQMNRLLQGDVGSGKTLVALMIILIGLDNKFQACLMAPTEILARQHYLTITRLLGDMEIKTGLLTGATRTNERKEIYAGIQSGNIQILIGTHALIEDTVQFKNLGLVVVDEQHKFGVAQRAKLWTKNESAPPHILVMTATPIPRTLAMTLYGDLDVSVIDELPPGRKPIQTLHMFDSKRLRMFGFLKKEISEGRQVYIVYPLIKESENMDYKDLQDGYVSITRAFPPPEYTVVPVHGQMKPDEKQKAMKLFIKGQAQIMVSTTVIEVGVDVPNASVMVIESAERFGLSQLHQLRGRVGRGARQSYCILMTSHKLSADAKKRLEIMVQTNNGFEIAEADLQLRGPGDLEGTQQSGIPFNLKMANLARDGHILQIARNRAIEIFEKDNLLDNQENNILKRNLALQKEQHFNWGIIS